MSKRFDEVTGLIIDNEGVGAAWDYMIVSNDTDESVIGHAGWAYAVASTLGKAKALQLEMGIRAKTLIIGPDGHIVG